MLLESFIKEILLLENKKSFAGFLSELVAIIKNKSVEEQQTLLKDDTIRFIFSLVDSDKIKYKDKKERKLVNKNLKIAVDNHIKEVVSNQEVQGFGVVLPLSQLSEYYAIILNYVLFIEEEDLKTVFSRFLIDVLKILSYHKTNIYNSLTQEEKAQIFSGETSILDIHYEVRSHKFRVTDGLDSKTELLNNSTLIYTNDEWFIVMPHSYNSFYEWTLTLVDENNIFRRENYKKNPEARVRWCTSLKGNPSHWEEYWSDKGLICLIAIKKGSHYNPEDDFRRISLKYKLDNNDTLSSSFMQNYYVKYDANNWDLNKIYSFGELVAKFPDSYDYELGQLDYHRFIDLDNLKIHYDIDLTDKLEKKLEGLSKTEFYYSTETVDSDNMNVLDVSEILTISEEVEIIKSLKQNEQKIEEIYNSIA